MIDRIVGRLPAKLQPLAKALVPSATILVGDIAAAVGTQSIDWPHIAVAGAAVLQAAATFYVPNYDPSGRLTPDSPDAA